ncbi:MAG: DUF6263 family protein [Ginsengibacter sp.]
MRKLIFPAVMLLGFGSGAFAQNKNLIDVKEGQKYIVENKINTQSTTEVQGQSMETNMDATSIYSIVVNKVADSIKLTNTVSGMKFSSSQMGQEIKFDSEKKEDIEGPIGSSLKDLLNNPKSITISKTGEVAKKSPQEENNVSNPLTNQLGDFESSGFGASLAFMALPAKLKVGNTWTENTENGGNTSVTTYTVKSLSENVATLSITGTNNTEMKMEQMGMEMTVKGKATVTGEQIVNIATGVIQSNTTTQNIIGTVDAMGMSFPTKTKMSSTTTVKML